MDESMYETGLSLGQHWARRDATEVQLLRVRELGDGRVWVSLHQDPAKEFTQIVDPTKDDFMGTGECPPVDFVAGFIDGARTIELSG